MRLSLLAFLVSATPGCLLGPHCDQHVAADFTSAGGVLDVTADGATRRLALGAMFGNLPWCAVHAERRPVDDDTGTVATTLDVACDEQGVADFTIALPDLRDLGIISTWLAPGSYRVALALTHAGAHCTADVQVPLEIDIGDASGGRAPYPRLVTDDFFRGVTLGFDLPAGSYAGFDDNWLPCRAEIDDHRLSMHVLQDATSYREVEDGCR